MLQSGLLLWKNSICRTNHRLRLKQIKTKQNEQEMAAHPQYGHGHADTTEGNRMELSHIRWFLAQTEEHYNS